LKAARQEDVSKDPELPSPRQLHATVYYFRLNLTLILRLLTPGNFVCIYTTQHICLW